MASVPMEKKKNVSHKKKTSGKNVREEKPKQKCTETSQQDVHAEVVYRVDCTHSVVHFSPIVPRQREKTT